MKSKLHPPGTGRVGPALALLAAALGTCGALAQQMTAPAGAPSMSQAAPQASPPTAPQATPQAGPQTSVVPSPGSTAPAPQPIPAAQWTAVQIRQSFDQADTNSDGQLSRAEAQRLAIMPYSFEDMDLNKDGILQRNEYEGAFSRGPGSQP